MEVVVKGIAEVMGRIEEMAKLFQGQSGYYAASRCSEASRGYIEQLGKPRSSLLKAPAARKGAVAVYSILQHVASNKLQKEFMEALLVEIEKSENHAVHLIETGRMVEHKHAAAQGEKP